VSVLLQCFGAVHKGTGILLFVLLYWDGAIKLGTGLLVCVCVCYCNILVQ